eukprot:UN13388
MGGQTPAYGGATPAYRSNEHDHNHNHSGVGVHGISRSNAWNVGGMTPAHMGAQTPVSPPYSGNYSTNDNMHTPSSYHSHNSHNSHGSNVMNHGLGLREQSESNNSESEQGDIDKAMQQDPFYFVIENALLSYNGQSVVIKDVDRSNGVCNVAYPSNHEVFQTGVLLQHVQHTVPSDLSNAKVKVVFGKLCGEIGSLIGIDNEEAVVQLSATT